MERFTPTDLTRSTIWNGLAGEIMSWDQTTLTTYEDEDTTTAEKRTISSYYLFQLVAVDVRPGTNNPEADISIFKIDIEYALNLVPVYLTQEPIDSLLRHTNFTAWLRSPESQFLFVHDKMAVPNIYGLTSYSYLCAAMSETLDGPTAIPLTFFCGLHAMDGDMFNGAKGMVRNLILQLLNAIGGNTVTVAPSNINAIVNGVEADDIEHLLSVLRVALGFLQSGMVLCLIDGAFWNVNGAGGMAWQMTRAIEFLHTLVDADNTGPVLKVLVTNPTPEQRSGWPAGAMDLYLQHYPNGSARRWSPLGEESF